MSSIACACSTDAREERRSDEAAVVVDARQAAGERDLGTAPRGRDRGQAAPVEQAGDGLAEQPAGGALVETRVRGQAQRHVERALRQPVGGIRGEHDPLGRRASEQLDDVQREEAGDVVEHAWVLGQHRGQDALVANRAVREDQHDLGVAQRQLGESLRDRGQAASGVDQDRHARLLGDREDALQLVAVEGELLAREDAA